jgi:hypothetical protein
MSLRDHCYNDLGNYFLALNPSYDYVSFQQKRIVPVLEGVECGDLERLMIFIHAGSAKTDLCTKAFGPWFLGRNPSKNLILFTHTQPLAKDYGSNIRNTMAKNEIHRQVFPDVKVNSTNHASDFFTLNKGGAFYAFGMDGGATGRRADLILMDDPIKSLEDALSETVQSVLYSTYKATIKDRLRPGGRIVMVITRWAPRDLPARILADEGDDWKVLVLMAQAPDPTKCEGCLANVKTKKNEGHDCTAPYLWEERFGKKPYEDAKRDPYIWNAKWQQVPEPRLAMGFQQEWLRFYEPKDREKIDRYNAYIFVDPAMGKSAAHDRSAILVLIAGPEKKIFWVDGVLDRLDPSERIEHLVRLTRIWRPKIIGYEEYSLTVDTHFLRRRFDEEGLTDVVITSIGRAGIKGMDGGRMKKEDRIMQLQPDFRDGLLWFPKRMIRRLEDGTDFDLVEYAINREILPFAGDGSLEHDDFLDCLSRVHSPEVIMEFAESGKDRAENYDTGNSSGSWESNY